ncbi:MAG TPA: hypothetical protein VFC63_18065 [Blastocatellia bacterium]|nr:hypothetical protein [Blastocatellia bacterium]
MKHIFIRCFALLVLFGLSSGNVFGQVRNIQMKIDGYLCGN